MFVAVVGLGFVGLTLSLALVEKGIKAQAVKVFRILGAIMNFAKAEEVSADRYSNTATERLIRDNPCDVLKEKRYDRHIPARTHALTAISALWLELA